ncbi:MAG: DUF4350 domain-containing protein [Gemmatimonadales bacterium]
MKRRIAIGMAGLLVVGSGLGASAVAQQVIDSGYRATVARPAYPAGGGPVVAIDAAHENFHTRTGRYRAFASLLEADGHRVVDSRVPFTASGFAGLAVLVIANAGMPASDWSLPARSAFTAAEIDAVVGWVEQGGALFLIADHLPAAGAATDLARRFGVEFTNGYTVAPRPAGSPPGDLFTRLDGTVADHPITRGRDAAERVDSVLTFTGQAFQLTEPAAVLLRFGPAANTWLPVLAGARFDSLTARVYSGGWPHAVAKRLGRGRVVLLGEAGGFSAQLSGPSRQPMGLNHPKSIGNQQFLLNILHRLTGLLD